MKLAVLLLALVACGSSIGDSPDAGGGDDAPLDPCAACAGACSPTLGCVECDPDATPMTCNGNAVVTCSPDGTFGETVQSCGEGTTCEAGACTKTCTADGVDLVYVVDEMNHFMSFDPRKLPNDPFTVIGTLSCPHNGTSIQTNNPTPMPFSMSVDRDGVAWVLFTTGELFKVSLQDASCTKANNTIGAGTMDLFGMGFALDDPMTEDEKLYIVGGNRDPGATPRKLAYDDTHNDNLTPSVVGTIAATSDYSPELTGNAEGKLYGFFPNITSVPFVQEIDKASGAALGQPWMLGTSGLGNGIRDWAFAQWGGVFWVFVTTETNGVRNSTVRSIDRTSGDYTIVLQDLPYWIDGAGVSTCAPAVLQ